jgi:hypothetical protein
MNRRTSSAGRRILQWLPNAALIFGFFSQKCNCGLSSIAPWSCGLALI